MAATRPLLLCLAGPTASGKTDLAIELAQRYDCELVSVDSVLVYRGMDIGSAKPTYPHHLIDICDPAQPYSAADFAADAARVIAQISARGRTPLLVGGTMLYFRALLQGLAPMPPADAQVREDIAALAARAGWPQVHRELQCVDPEAAAHIHPHHSQRLSRALEVYRLTGTPLSQWHRCDPGPPAAIRRFRVVQLALVPQERGLLHERIARRLALMMEAGLLDEVRQLWRRPDLHSALPAMRAVAYRQLWQHLDGECSLEDAVERALAATRQLAKRQLTWLRKWPELQEIRVDREGNVVNMEELGLAAGACGSRAADVAGNYLDRVET